MQTEKITDTFYRSRVDVYSPWTYRHRDYPLCSELSPSQLLIGQIPYDAKKGTQPLNMIMSMLHYPGVFNWAAYNFTRGRSDPAQVLQLWYSDRWPYPTIKAFPGMIIDRQGKVRNGAFDEIADRILFKSALTFYCNLLKRYLKYKKQYPLPDDKDCHVCRGIVKEVQTMYWPGHHMRKHLLNYEFSGTLLWQALLEEGYGEGGIMSVLGYGDFPADAERLTMAIRLFFQKRGGF